MSQLSLISPRGSESHLTLTDQPLCQAWVSRSGTSTIRRLYSRTLYLFCENFYEDKSDRHVRHVGFVNILTRAYYIMKNIRTKAQKDFCLLPPIIGVKRIGLSGRLEETVGGGSFLMVLIYDFEAMEWTKIMSVDDLTSVYSDLVCLLSSPLIGQ